MVELWNIGDVVLTIPFLAQLRAIFTEAEITLLARPYAAEILAGTGLVDRFIEAELTWKTEGRSFNPLNYNWAELLRVVPVLRERNFDLAFQCRPHAREYALVAVSGARRRVGYAKPGWGRLLTDAIAFGDSEVQKKDAWLRLLEPFGGPRKIEIPALGVSGDEQLWATEFLRTNGADPSNLLVAIHAGASVPEKRWPIERFAEVARDLGARTNVDVLAFIEPEGYGSAIAAVDGVIPAQVELRQMIALLARCDLLVCNDSGPMHIAGALGVPTVAIFGSGINHQFAPLGDQHELVTAGLGPGPARERAPGAGPYDDVSRMCPPPKFWRRSSVGCSRQRLTAPVNDRLEFCSSMAGDDYGYPLNLPTTGSRLTETQVLTHPALQRRSALRARRPATARRHTGRVATRFVVLLVGDILSILLARAFAFWLADETTFGAFALPDSPLIVGGTRFVFLGLLTIGAVFATGGHSRHRALNQPIRLFVGVAGAVLLMWAGGIARGLLSDLVLPIVTTAGILWLSLLLVRQFSGVVPA